MFSLGDLAPPGYAGTKLLNAQETRLETLIQRRKSSLKLHFYQGAIAYSSRSVATAAKRVHCQT